MKKIRRAASDTDYIVLVVFCLDNVHENGKRWVRGPGISLDAYLDRQKIDTA